METTKKPKPAAIVKPDVTHGRYIITEFSKGFDSFIHFAKKKKDRKVLFHSIFEPHKVKHLLGKYPGYDDFGPFYLNLDHKCQEGILNWISEGKIDLSLPDIEGWEAMAEKYCKGDKEHPFYCMDEMRKLCIMFGEKNRWDVSNHSMEFIFLYLLYANNHSLDGYEFQEPVKSVFVNYKGEKYGNYANWNRFWKQADADTQLAIVAKLVEYIR